MKVSFNSTEKQMNPINMATSTKSERQEVAIERWRQAKGKGTLNIIQRFGKTRIGLMICERLLNKAKQQILIVTPNAQMQSQWTLELNMYASNKDIDVGYINIVTSTMFSKMSLFIEGFIIFDEIHKYILLDSVYNKMVELTCFSLGLTGTVSQEIVQRLNVVCPIVDTIEEEEALRNNWIAPYEEFNYLIEFSKFEQIQYIKYSEYITEILSQFTGMANAIRLADIYNNYYFNFKSDYDVIVGCVAGGYDLTSRTYIKGAEMRTIIGKVAGWSRDLDLHTEYGLALDKAWSNENLKSLSLTFMDFIRHRNDLITKSDEKLKAILQIIKEEPELETLIYTGNIEFAERVTDFINNMFKKEVAIAFHSKIPSRPLIDESTNDYFRYKSGSNKGQPKMFGQSKIKEYYVEALKKNKYKILVTVESLNEGLNIPNLKRVITTAGSKSSLKHEQRSARVKTIDLNDLDKNGIIINIAFDNFMYNNQKVISRDLTKLIKRQEGTNSSPTFKKYIIK